MLSGMTRCMAVRLRRGLAAFSLLLLAAGDLHVLAASAPPCCDSRTESACPRCHPAKRAARSARGPASAQAESAPPPCHGGGAGTAEEPPPASGDKCSLTAGCKCGHSHSPSGVAWDHPATLVPAVATEVPDPGTPFVLRGGLRVSLPLSAPEPPPPRPQTV